MKILDIQSSPNPKAVKIVTDTMLTPPGQVPSSKSYTIHPLSKEIESLTPVEDVYVQGQWVCVTFQTKQERGDRQCLKDVAQIIRSYEEPSTQKTETETTPELDEDPQLMLIRDVIEDEVMPYLNAHGGSIELVGLEDNTVFIRYIGACGGCPASMTGTLQAIEKILQFEIDPDLEVQTV